MGKMKKEKGKRKKEKIGGLSREREFLMAEYM